MDGFRVDITLRCSTSFKSQEEYDKFMLEAAQSDWVRVTLITQGGLGSWKSGGLNGLTIEVK